MHGRPVGLARGPEGSYRANSVVGRARAETALLTEMEMSLVASLDLDREKPVESNQISLRNQLKPSWPPRVTSSLGLHTL